MTNEHDGQKVTRISTFSPKTHKLNLPLPPGSLTTPRLGIAGLQSGKAEKTSHFSFATPRSRSNNVSHRFALPPSSNSSRSLLGRTTPISTPISSPAIKLKSVVTPQATETVRDPPIDKRSDIFSSEVGLPSALSSSLNKSDEINSKSHEETAQNDLNLSKPCSDSITLKTDAADELSPLPEGWIEITDADTGSCYYFNIDNETTQWDRPTKRMETNGENLISQSTPLQEQEYMQQSTQVDAYSDEHQTEPVPVASEKETDTGTLPDGWVPVVDEQTGETYYYNALTNITSWDFPTQNKDVDVIETCQSSEEPTQISDGVEGFDYEDRLEFKDSTYSDPTNSTTIEQIEVDDSKLMISSKLGENLEEKEPDPMTLRSEWVEAIDEDSKLPFYFNIVTGLTQWEFPTVNETQSADTTPLAAEEYSKIVDEHPTVIQEHANLTTEIVEEEKEILDDDLDDLPTGWTLCVDKESEYQYYANESLGLVQWEKPTASIVTISNTDPQFLNSDFSDRISELVPPEADNEPDHIDPDKCFGDDGPDTTIGTDPHESIYKDSQVEHDKDNEFSHEDTFQHTSNDESHEIKNSQSGFRNLNSVDTNFDSIQYDDEGGKEDGDQQTPDTPFTLDEPARELNEDFTKADDASTTHEQSLPPGWIELIDAASGLAYYFMESEGITRWERPTLDLDCQGNTSNSYEERNTSEAMGFDSVIDLTTMEATDVSKEISMQHPQESDRVSKTMYEELPVGWSQEIEESTGVPFYFCVTTGVTQWNHPSEPILDIDPLVPSTESVENLNGAETNSIGDSFREIKQKTETQPSAEAEIETTCGVTVGMETLYVSPDVTATPPTQLLDEDLNSISDTGDKLTEAPVISELPLGWKKLIDEASGSPYFFNEVDGTTQWESPKQEVDANITPDSMTNILDVVKGESNDNLDAQIQHGDVISFNSISEPSVPVFLQQDSEGTESKVGSIMMIDQSVSNEYNDSNDKSIDDRHLSKPDLVESRLSKTVENEPLEGPVGPLGAEDLVIESSVTNDALPSGWVQLLDESSGEPFYYNDHIGVTQWVLPSDHEEKMQSTTLHNDSVTYERDEAATSAVGDNQKSESSKSVTDVIDEGFDTEELPDGWAKHIDDSSGLPFYYCETDGSTHWTLPILDNLTTGESESNLLVIEQKTAEQSVENDVLDVSVHEYRNLSHVNDKGEISNSTYEPIHHDLPEQENLTKQRQELESSGMISELYNLQPEASTPHNLSDNDFNAEEFSHPDLTISSVKEVPVSHYSDQNVEQNCEKCTKNEFVNELSDLHENPQASANGVKPSTITSQHSALQAVALSQEPTTTDIVIDSECFQREDAISLEVLPFGWIELVDDATGTPYYYNEAENLTQWDRPSFDATGLIACHNTHEELKEFPISISKDTEVVDHVSDGGLKKDHVSLIEQEQDGSSLPIPLTNTESAGTDQYGAKKEFGVRAKSGQKAHAFAIFGFGGRICIYKPDKNKLTIQRTFHLVPTDAIVEVEKFKQSCGIMGPLQTCAGDLVRSYIEKVCERANDQLWDLIGLASESRGRLRSIDGVIDSESPESKIIAMALPPNDLEPECSNGFPSGFEANSNILQDLLFRGHREEAVTEAISSKNYAIAFLTSAMCSRELFQYTGKMFAEANFANGDPQYTIAMLFSGNLRSDTATNFWECSDKARLCRTWNFHLAIILSNRTPDWEHILIALGDRLLELGEVVPSHFCYMVCGCPVTMPFRSGSRLTLLGCDVTQRDMLLMSNHSVFGLERTEAYEWTKRLGNRNAAIPCLDWFKWIYAVVLADYGFQKSASLYIQSLIDSLEKNSDRELNSFSRRGLAATHLIAEDKESRINMLKDFQHRLDFEDNTNFHIIKTDNLITNFNQANDSSPVNYKKSDDLNTKFTIDAQDHSVTEVRANQNEPSSLDDTFKAENFLKVEEVRSNPDTAHQSTSGKEEIVISKETENKVYQKPIVVSPAINGSQSLSQKASFSGSQALDTQEVKDLRESIDAPIVTKEKSLKQSISTRKPPSAPASAPANLERSSKKAPASGGLMDLIPSSIRGSITKLFPNKAVVADVGDPMQAYYDKENKVWVFPGEDPAELVKPIGPPPKVSAVLPESPLIKPPSISVDPLAAMMAPPSRIPSSLKSRTPRTQGFPTPKNGNATIPAQFSVFTPPSSSLTKNED